MAGSENEPPPPPDQPPDPPSDPPSDPPLDPSLDPPLDPDPPLPAALIPEIAAAVDLPPARTGKSARPGRFDILFDLFRRNPWKVIDDETPTPTPTPERRFFSPVVLVVLLTVAVSLTLQEYIGDRGTFNKWFPQQGKDQYYELKSFAWWAGWRVLGYMILPMLVIAAMPGQRIRDYYISPRGFFRHLPVYVVLFLLILPAVFLAAQTKSFQHTYPFYKYANRSTFDLVAWEALYAAQFLALEFFFRGFMLQGLREKLGSNAIFVMIVPYCMIHYGKPLPETLGAIGAGVILGTLAMRTRSIWGGVVIHVAVAVTMDVLALRACPYGGRPCGY
jgi:membrane protease YdiL (CAAX protease family)